MRRKNGAKQRAVVNRLRPSVDDHATLSKRALPAKRSHGDAQGTRLLANEHRHNVGRSRVVSPLPRGCDALCLKNGFQVGGVNRENQNVHTRRRTLVISAANNRSR